MHVCFMQIKERAAAPPGDLLFAKALSYAISVEKAVCVHNRAITNHVRRKMSVSVVINVVSQARLSVLSGPRDYYQQAFLAN